MKVCDYRIGFIGFGHMAQIIFRGFDLAKLVPRSHISFIRRDTHKMREDEKKFGITSTSLKHLVEQSQILILGIRPAQTEALLQELSPLMSHGKMVITMVAGLKLGFYQKYFNDKAQVLRVMPNIASSVQSGMSVFTFGNGASEEFKSLSRFLFSSLGEVMEVDEKLMDISCAIAGSGPGFVFRLIEAMARSGEKEGLSYEEALKMAAQVFLGASRLILEGGKPEDLLYRIATPNGTTEAGLNVMKQMELAKHFQMAVEAAALRSRHLRSS